MSSTFDISLEIEQAVHQYSDGMYQWALHKITDKEGAQDLVQETFLAAFKSKDTFNGKSELKTWLYAILNRKVIDYYRSKTKEALLFQANNPDAEEGFFNEQERWKPQMFDEDWGQVENHLLDDKAFVEVLDLCMNNLPSTWGSAIKAKYLNAQDAKEICKELNVSTSNYWQIIRRAKLQLRDCLEQNWFKKK